MSPDADPTNRKGRWRYEAEPVIDFAQKAREDAAEAWREGKNSTHGVTFRVKKVDRPSA